MHLALRPRGRIASLGVLMLIALASAITLVSVLKQLEDQAWVEHTLDVRSRLLRRWRQCRTPKPANADFC